MDVDRSLLIAKVLLAGFTLIVVMIFVGMAMSSGRLF
jgi:hypothetical protein